VRWLQRLVDVPADGAIGPTTLAAVNALPGRLVTNAYVAQRAHAADAGNVKYRNGLITRALAFVVPVDDLP
jgi:lysozyme family protein